MKKSKKERIKQTIRYNEHWLAELYERQNQLQRQLENTQKKLANLKAELQKMVP
jgi:hypothetical protein